MHKDPFWSKVAAATPTECWLWQAAVNPRGYGVFQGRNASRVAWELTYGPVPAGLHVLHSCDTPLCVNPKHLMVGSPIANVRDMDAKRRRGDTQRRGERRLKLTDAEVAEVRRLAALGWTHERLAVKYAMSRQGIGAIVRGTRRAA